MNLDSDERQRTVSGNALDHLVIVALLLQNECIPNVRLIVTCPFRNESLANVQTIVLSHTDSPEYIEACMCGADDHPGHLRVPVHLLDLLLSLVYK